MQHLLICEGNEGEALQSRPNTTASEGDEAVDELFEVDIGGEEILEGNQRGNGAQEHTTRNSLMW